MQTALAAEDTEGLVEADTRLHDAIAEASGNSILAETLRSLSLLAMESRRVTWAIPGHPRRSVPEHGKVVQAIAARNKLAAAKAMFRHVRGAREEVLTTLSASVSLAGVIGVTGKAGNGKGVHG
jgi:GntR family transcriptional repressor for pyruvate dehydrogenase complex